MAIAGKENALVETRKAKPGGRYEDVTLTKETSTPRARSLTATFKRVVTPPGESQSARRQRKKNEGKARGRAIVRLDADAHARYKQAERLRKGYATPATAWAPPTFWQPYEMSGSEESSSEESSGTRLHEHVQMTPRGSRVHSFEHTSPGGTVRLEEYKSPAFVRATRQQRCGWRWRIAWARRESQAMAGLKRLHEEWLANKQIEVPHPFLAKNRWPHRRENEEEEEYWARVGDAWPHQRENEEREEYSARVMIRGRQGEHRRACGCASWAPPCACEDESDSEEDEEDDYYSDYM